MSEFGKLYAVEIDPEEYTHGHSLRLQAGELIVGQLCYLNMLYIDGNCYRFPAIPTEIAPKKTNHAVKATTYTASGEKHRSTIELNNNHLYLPQQGTGYIGGYFAGSEYEGWDSDLATLLEQKTKTPA